MSYYRRHRRISNWSAEDKAWFNYRDWQRSKGNPPLRSDWDKLSAEEKAEASEKIKKERKEAAVARKIAEDQYQAELSKSKAERAAERIASTAIFGEEKEYESRWIPEVFDFSSLSAFRKACEEARISFSSEGWYSNDSSESALNKAVVGDHKALEDAKKTEREFLDCVDLSNMLPRYDLSAVGSFPCVAAALTGMPESMYRRTNEIVDAKPVKIYFVVTSSAGCEVDQLRARGIACAALYMALSMIRPVELYVVSGLSGGQGGKLVRIKLENPVNLSQFAYVMSSQGFSRGLTYKYLQANGSGGGWPECWNTSYDRNIRNSSIRKSLGASKDDLIFPFSFMGDIDLDNPIAFCKKVLTEYKVIKDE